MKRMGKRLEKAGSNGSSWDEALAEIAGALKRNIKSYVAMDQFI